MEDISLKKEIALTAEKMVIPALVTIGTFNPVIATLIITGLWFYQITQAYSQEKVNNFIIKMENQKK